MSTKTIVSNSSPLIGLEQIGLLNLFEKLFASTVVPPAVVRETAPTVNLPGWITIQPLNQPISPQILQASLGAGETEAISLALEIKPDLIVLDDRSARRLAQSLNLKVIGILGVLLDAKKKAHLTEVRSNLDNLINFGFRVSPQIYNQVLVKAGEVP
jgi:predicted nucleic acid-binding protein